MKEPEKPKKNPELPQLKPDKVLPEISSVVSCGECTGLIPAAPADEAQRESYQELSTNALPEV